MLWGFRSLRDWDLGLEFEVNLKYSNVNDDFCFLKTLIGDTVFLCILSSFNGYYFHTRLKENRKSFKEEISKIVLSFNPVIFSQDFNFSNDFFQKIVERKSMKIENTPVKPFFNVLYPLFGYIDNLDKINFQANMNFNWNGDILDVSIHVMRNIYMVFNVDIREFSSYNGYSVKFYDVDYGKMFFVVPFDVSFHRTTLGNVFRIFSEKEGIIYERFIFNVYNTAEGYIVYWASSSGVNQLIFPKNYNILSMVFSCLINYFGNFLNLTKGIQIDIPYWMFSKNMRELSNNSYYYEGSVANLNFYSFMEVENYKNIFYEITVDFMVGYSRDWFFYIRAATDWDMNFYIQNYTRLLHKQKKIAESVNFIEKFNRDFYNRMANISSNSWVYDKQISDIIYRNTMEEIAHRRKMYQKLRETNDYVNSIYRETIYKSNKQREAFTKGFSAAINNETYVRSETGQIYRVPRSEGFSNINYYEDQDLIVGVKDYDFSNAQYLQSLGFKKMEEDISGFVE